MKKIILFGLFLILNCSVFGEVISFRDNTKVKKSGDTMTGNLTVPSVKVSSITFADNTILVSTASFPQISEYWSALDGDIYNTNENNVAVGSITTRGEGYPLAPSRLTVNYGDLEITAQGRGLVFYDELTDQRYRFTIRGGTLTIKEVIALRILTENSSFYTMYMQEDYAFNLVATGEGEHPETGHYKWSIFSGSLPDPTNLVFTSTGAIFGKPDLAPEFYPFSSTFTVRVENYMQPPTIIYKVFTLTIQLRPLQNLTTELDPFYYDRNYYLRISTSGGYAPMKYEIIGGTLPYGISFSTATGEIYGAPISTWTPINTVTIRITDKFSGVAPNRVSTTTYNWQVGLYPLSILSTTLPGFYEGEYYSYQVAVDSQYPPITFSISDGALPTGTTMNMYGVISGTPTVVDQEFNFTVQVQDAFMQIATMTYSGIVKMAYPSGLVALWTFDEGEGYQTTDKIDGKILYSSLYEGETWPSWVDSVKPEFGKAMFYNQTGDTINYSTAAYHPDFWFADQSFSFGCLFYRKGNIEGPYLNNIIMMNGENNVEGAYYVRINPTEIAVVFATPYTIDINTTVPPLNTWNFVMGVYDHSAQKIRMYLNGEFVEEKSLLMPTTQIPGKFFVGAQPAWSNHFYYGYVDEVQIYNRALTESEIQALWNRYKP